MKYLGFLFFLFFLSMCVFAQENDELSLLAPVSETLDKVSIFNDEEPLVLTLKYDITSFVRHKTKGEYLNVEFRLHVSETDSVVKNIRLKARGNFRKGHCFFPPIYLNFKTDPIKQSELEGIKKIKLVTHCSSSKSYQTYIMKEYLAYKIYNLLTDNCFRVRLLDINYIDTGKKQRHYLQHGFLIEPLDLVVKRIGATEVNSEMVKGPDIIEEQLDVVSMFQYLIANTDWRAKGGHNMKYAKSLTAVTSKVIPIPYDYDYSGFVGTSYSHPQEWVSIERVTEREYLGYCRNSDEEYKKVIDLFIQKKEEILNTITNFSYLDKKERERIIVFVESFYKLAERPDVLIRVMKKECRNKDF